MDIKSEIIRVLKANSRDFTSGEKMSAKFGLSRAALWKHISRIRQEGYVIESYPRRGYRLTSVPDRLSAAEIRDGLGTRVIGRGEIHVFAEVPSTNKTACAFSEKGAPEGTLVTAESQSRGRGRMGRIWESPPGGGLYFSIVLRPDMSVDRMPGFTLVAASAVAKAVNKACGLSCRVKWPNDIFAGGGKICGILVETRAHSDLTDFIVLGVGINVNTPGSKLPENAASIMEVSGRKTDRTALLRRVLEELENAYFVFAEKGFPAFLNESRRLSLTLGREVSVDMRGKIVSGEAFDLDERGALLVRTPDKKVHVIFSGDVSGGAGGS